MISIIRYTILTALRDLLFIGLFVIILGAIGISFTLGATALSEQDQMVLTYIAGSVRLILVTGTILFICFHVQRAFDNKEIDLTLSRPISRTRFVISYWVAFAVLATIMTIPVIGVVAFVAKGADSLGLAYWGFTLLCEITLVCAFALVAALVMQSAVTSALSTLGFYLVARLMGFLILTIRAIPAAPNGSAGQKITWFMETVIRMLSIVFPRLDLSCKTSWLLYGVHNDPNLWIFPIGAVVFIPLLLSVAIYDLKRKQF